VLSTMIERRWNLLGFGVKCGVVVAVVVGGV
jgi:hypothetical protein